ncbi:MAG: hypothetical protein J6O41_03475 [Clostridia bacterium]|nr:hypothetical protein [Clostridia bacterium]
MKKIKWLNVMKFVMFVFCVSILLHDLYVISIKSWITGYQASFTIYGFITFLLLFTISSFLYDDFEEQIKKYPQATKLKKDTRKHL